MFAHVPSISFCLFRFKILCYSMSGGVKGCAGATAPRVAAFLKMPVTASPGTWRCFEERVSQLFIAFPTTVSFSRLAEVLVPG